MEFGSSLFLFHASTRQLVLKHLYPVGLLHDKIVFSLSSHLKDFAYVGLIHCLHHSISFNDLHIYLGPSQDVQGQLYPGKLTRVHGFKEMLVPRGG